MPGTRWRCEMTNQNNKIRSKKHVDSSPQSALERELITEHLRNKGYRREDLRKLPKEEAKKLMKDACMYASLKLTEIEAKVSFRQKIRYEQ
jgi:hypothetical protein